MSLKVVVPPTLWKKPHISTSKAIRSDKRKRSPPPPKKAKPFFNFWAILSSGMVIPDVEEYKNTAGAILRINGKPLSHDEKWKYIKPYWENARYTGYSRAALYSIQKNLGIGDLNDNTYRDVSEKLAGLIKPGVYHSMLKDICGFTHIINDIDTMAVPGSYQRMDRNLLQFVARFRDFVYAYLPFFLF